MKTIFLVLLILIGYATASEGANIIATTAGTMTAGQWQQITTTGMNTLDIWSAPSVPGDYTLQTSPKFDWDPFNHKLYFTGGAHGCCGLPSYGYATFASYDAVNDQWARIGRVYYPEGDALWCPIAYPCTAPDLTTWQTQPKYWAHTYNNETFVQNPSGTALGRWFGATQSEPWMFSYNPASPPPAGQYRFVRKTDMPFPPGFYGFQYFPEMDRIFILAQNAYTFYNPNTDQYGSTPTNNNGQAVAGPYIGPSGVSNPNPYQQWAVYSTKDHVVYFGGGNDTQPAPTSSGCGHRTPDNIGNVYTCMWRMDSSGSITRIADSPAPIVIGTSRSGGLLVVDPITGHLLYWGYNLLTDNALHFYEYDPTTNCGQTPNVGCWTTHSSGTNPPWFTTGTLGSTGDISEAIGAFPEYGVIGVIHFMGDGTSQFWLYKNAANDFQARCAGPGVIRCFSFDTTADLGTVGFGNNVGTFNSSGYPNTAPNVPVIDNSVFVDGTGSLRFDVPSQTNSGGSGQWYANFSSNLATQFGPNSDFYIQWREMHSASHLNTLYWGTATSDAALTLSASTVGTGRTATLTGGTTNFTGMQGRNFYVLPFDLSQGLATITTVTDATHAVVTIVNAFTSTSYAAGAWSNSFANSAGFKQTSVGTGDQTGCTPSDTTNCYSSCNELDIPTQNVNQEGFLQTYTSCSPLQWSPNGTISPSATTGSGITMTASIANFDSNYVGWQIIELATGATAIITSVTNSTHVIANVVVGTFSTTGAISNWRVFVKNPYTPMNQNFSNPLYGGATDIAFQDRASPYCSYLGTHDTPPRVFPPSGNCFGYFPNEWITYTAHYHVGNFVFGTNTQALVNSHYTLRAARFGQASQIVIDQPVIFNGGVQSVNERYGKIWLLPYQTSKDPSQITTTAQVWYDSLIISTQDIPDPAGGGGGPTLNPVVVHIGSGKTARVGNGQVFRSGLN